MTDHRQQRRVRHATDRWPSIIRLDPCVYCGKPMTRTRRKRTLEHLTPKAQGGQTCWENVAAACAECNSKRRDVPFVRFMVSERRFLDRRRAYWTLYAAQRAGQAPSGAGWTLRRLQREMDSR